jgi:hypothetical protein
MWASAAQTPLPIVKGCMLLLESCPACQGVPKITCESCHTDLLALGIAVFRILSSTPS